MPRRRRIGTAVLGAMVLLSACGGDDKAATDNTTANGASLFEKIYGTGEDQSARQLQVEEKTRDCMKAKGWEYIPVDYSQFNRESQNVDFNDATSFKKKYGYGISTFIGKEDELGGGSSSVEFKDPNQEYVDKLSDTDRDAYYKDLYGDSGSFEENATVPATVPPPSGCANEAQQSVYGSIMTDEKLGEQLNQVYTDIQADERVVKAQAKWATCMKAAGYDFENQDAIYSYLQPKLDKIMGTDSADVGIEGEGTAPDVTVVGVPETAAPASASGSAAGGDSTDTTDGGFVDPNAGGSGDDPGNGNGGPIDETPTLPQDYDKAALTSLQDEEMKIAGADLACEEKFVKKVMEQVTKEYEDQFLSDNPDVAKQINGK